MAPEEKLGERLRKQLREIYNVASVRTEEYARIGKKRLDILSLGRDVAREKKALGERVYELSQRDNPPPVLEDVTVRAILGRIKRLEEQIRQKEEEIARIREEARRAREAALRREEGATPPAGPEAEGGEAPAAPGDGPSPDAPA
jgi:hypothetical protein